VETATSGRVEIESKDDAKKGGQSSPDRAEALVLAFAWVVPRQQTIVWSAPYTISSPIGIKAAKGWLQITR
jgi:hypothetical protein